LKSPSTGQIPSHIQDNFAEILKHLAAIGKLSEELLSSFGRNNNQTPDPINPFADIINSKGFNILTATGIFTALKRDDK
jgi:hypothetical protein